MWCKNYVSHLKYITSTTDVEAHIEKLKTEATKIFAKRSDYSMFKKYYDHLIEFQGNKFKNDVCNTITDHKENICHKAQVLIKPLDKNLLEKNIVNEISSKKKSMLESLSQYELAYLIRGHSKDNNIEDSSTSVTDAAFEPRIISGRLEAMPSYTNICATSGNNIINLIDVESGKIMKRFVDEMVFKKNKEVDVLFKFYLLSLKIATDYS